MNMLCVIIFMGWFTTVPEEKLFLDQKIFCDASPFLNIFSIMNMLVVMVFISTGLYFLPPQSKESLRYRKKQCCKLKHPENRQFQIYSRGPTPQCCETIHENRSSMGGT